MIRPISLALARRLAITRQRLAGPRPAPGPAGLLEVARDLGCVQLDPINAVYAEPTAPRDRATAQAVAGAVEDLARFLGAGDIVYGRRRVPPAWKAALS